MSDIYLEVNGVRYVGFTDITVSKSLENLTGEFSFSTTVKEGVNGVIQNDLKVQDEVKIYVDDNLFLTGYIEDLNISYSVDSHSISVAGRDKTGDLIDSSIKPNSFSQTNFIKLARLVLNDNGYNNIEVINNVKNLPSLTVGATSNASNLEDNEKPNTEREETIASYLDRYARKIQCLLITDENGNIIVTTEGSELSGGALISSNNRANILSANINVSTVDRFRFIEMYSQGDNQSFEVDGVNQSGNAIDNTIRNPRRKIISISTPSQTNSLNNLAVWNVNIRKAKGLRYNCTVQDFYASKDQNKLWFPNTLVQIKDDKCQIDGQFLIQGVTFRKNEQGSFTDLSIVERGSFSVEPQIIADSTSNIGENLIDKLLPI